MSRPKPKYDPQVVYEVCHAFIEERQSVEQIKDGLIATGRIPHATRETVYKIVREEGVANGMIQLRAPEELTLGAAIRTLHPVDAMVLDLEGKLAPKAVARRGAEKVLELIRGLAKQGKEKIQIGMGAGYVTQEFAESLAGLLRAETDLPKLVLQAMTSGFFVRRPTTAPISFFALFKNLPNIEYIGLFAPAMVRWDEYAATLRNPGIDEALQLTRDLDILVTSFASARDEDGLLNRFMREYGGQDQIDALNAAGWIGDILWQPFNETGPIHLQSGVRAVSLFGIDDLVRFSATPDKHVICFAAACSVCGHTKSDALRPLLKAPALRVFNHVIMDKATARELV